MNKLSQPSTPSKVLHLRNLPYETTDEELREICAPFGPLLQTKLSVGPNKNQAFVEFGDVGAAMNMVNYYTSSEDSAKIRGKTVYLQYSTRQEITNSRPQVEVASNVLLVSLENLTPGLQITIETLHIVFSAFGSVQKIATFQKSAGFQALIQYSDTATADKVRLSLDGRHIPRHLLNDTPNPPLLKISFSQHQDLNVKFQSHRSRDYTNPYLPVAPTGQEALPNQSATGGGESEGNVLLCAVDNYAYPVVVDALHTVFSPYGFVQKIAIFEKNQTWQAFIQFSDPMSAANAKQALEGHAIYDGGYNRLKINYSLHRDLNIKGNNERSWDYTNQAAAAPPPLVPPAYAMQNGMGGPYVPPMPQYGGTNDNGEIIVTGQDYENVHIAIAKAVESAGSQPRPTHAFAAGPQYGPPAQAPSYHQPSPAPVYQSPQAPVARPAFPSGPGAQPMYQQGPPQPAYGQHGAPPPAYPPPQQGAPYYAPPPQAPSVQGAQQYGAPPSAQQPPQYSHPSGPRPAAPQAGQQYSSQPPSTYQPQAAYPGTGYAGQAQYGGASAAAQAYAPPPSTQAYGQAGQNQQAAMQQYQPY